MTESILETNQLVKRFHSVVAVDGITVSYPRDKVSAIIGPNGAGKTTFFNVLSGSLQPSSGAISFDGEDITGLKAHDVASKGLVRSFQITNIFPELSVLKNVQIAVQTSQNPYNFWSRADDLSGVLAEAEAVLERVGLLERRDVPAGNLSHGEQRTLEIATTLGAEPKMLLLDEPTAGMSSSETEDVVSLIDTLADELPVLIVEHKMGVVRQIADRVDVFHRGELLTSGTPNEIQQDEQVRRIYLKEETIDA